MNLHEYICIDIENKITSKKERDFIEECKSSRWIKRMREREMAGQEGEGEERKEGWYKNRANNKEQPQILEQVTTTIVPRFYK